MPAANCSVPQMKSLAGVAAQRRPRWSGRSCSPGDSACEMAKLLLADQAAESR
jgi:hypothetical protein